MPLLHHFRKDLWIHPSEQIWFWLFLSNWRIALGYNDGTQIAHFWSLAIEEQFYLVWSLLVWLIGSRGICRLSITLFFAVTALRAWLVFHGTPYHFIYFSSVTRLDDLALGASLAVSVPFRRAVARIAWPLIVACALLSFFNLPFGLNFSIFAVGSGALVARATTTSIRWLRTPWLQTAGKYSFGLYVLHFVVHGAMEPVVLRFHSKPLVLCAIILLGAVASVLLAILSWKFLEQPVLSLKKYVPYEFPTAHARLKRPRFTSP